MYKNTDQFTELLSDIRWLTGRIYHIEAAIMDEKAKVEPNKAKIHDRERGLDRDYALLQEWKAKAFDMLAEKLDGIL